MSLFRIIVIAMISAGIAGCENIALTAGSIAKEAGVDQSSTGTTYKTFATSIPTMRTATLQTLNRMGIRVKGDKAYFIDNSVNRMPNEEGWAIMGEANGRDIEINLERVSRRTTRMRVNVGSGIPLIHDAATGTEIILQTSETVEGLAVRG